MPLLPLFAQFGRDADPNASPFDVVWPLVIGAIVIVVALVLLIVALAYGKIWFQAYMSNARVSLMSLIGMSFRQVNARVIVQGKIMAMQAGVGNDPNSPITTRRLEGHYLAGGDVPRVVRAIIAAHRADLDLDFDRAAAIDLAGRDVLDAVQTSVNPKVIDCPDPDSSRRTFLSAIAKNGVELRVRARVTVRTNLPAPHRRRHRRDHHRPRRRGNHHCHRLVRKPPARDGKPRPHLQSRRSSVG